MVWSYDILDFLATVGLVCLTAFILLVRMVLYWYSTPASQDINDVPIRRNYDCVCLHCGAKVKTPWLPSAGGIPTRNVLCDACKNRILTAVRSRLADSKETEER